MPLKDVNHSGFVGGLIHHSGRGCQNRSIRYNEKLAEAGIDASVGSVEDSYDNALAETINGLYKTEVICHRGPWKNIDEVEYVTLIGLTGLIIATFWNRLEIVQSYAYFILMTAFTEN